MLSLATIINNLSNKVKTIEARITTLESSLTEDKATPQPKAGNAQALVGSTVGNNPHDYVNNNTLNGINLPEVGKTPDVSGLVFCETITERDNLQPREGRMAKVEQTDELYVYEDNMWKTDRRHTSPSRVGYTTLQPLSEDKIEEIIKSMETHKDTGREGDMIMIYEDTMKEILQGIGTTPQVDKKLDVDSLAEQIDGMIHEYKNHIVDVDCVEDYNIEYIKELLRGIGNRPKITKKEIEKRVEDNGSGDGMTEIPIVIDFAKAHDLSVDD